MVLPSALAPVHQAVIPPVLIINFFPMGAVECSKHGLQINSGPLSCKHIRSAIFENHRSIKSVAFSIDLLDNGSVILDAVVCESCNKDLQISDGQKLASNEWSKLNKEKGFPSIAPICPECFSNYKLVEQSLVLLRGAGDDD